VNQNKKALLLKNSSKEYFFFFFLLILPNYSLPIPFSAKKAAYLQALNKLAGSSLFKEWLTNFPSGQYGAETATILNDILFSFQYFIVKVHSK